MKITFLGAAHEVTGSCTYLEVGDKKGLVDCGMEQGKNLFENEPIPVPASELDFVLLTQEIAQAIDYYIVTPHREQRVKVPKPSQIDIQLWLQWLDDYLVGAITILDGVVLGENTIDYDALLAQAKKELYEQLHPELLEKLIMQTKEELHQEIQQLTDSLTIYIRETLKTELSNQLSSDIESRSTLLSDRLTESMDLMSKDLAKSLYDKLFSDIYIGVYNVLHEEEEDHFIPMI